MVVFEQRDDVAAPSRLMWDVLLDVARWPEWTPSIRSAEPAGGAALAVGLHVRVRQPRLPPATWTVTRLTEPTELTWTSRAPGLRTTAEHLVTGAGDACALTLRITQAGPLAGVVGGVSAGLTRRYLALEARGLRDEAERRARVTSG